MAMPVAVRGFILDQMGNRRRGLPVVGCRDGEGALDPPMDDHSADGQAADRPDRLMRSFLNVFADPPDKPFSEALPRAVFRGGWHFRRGSNR